MLDKAKVNYSRVTIFQASVIEEILEELKINRYEITIASMDSINMYHSIKISTINKAVRLFTKLLTTSAWSSSALGWDLTWSPLTGGITNTTVLRREKNGYQFVDKNRQSLPT